MRETRFVNLIDRCDDPDITPSGWYVDDVFKVITLVKEYIDRKHLSGATICEVEDNRDSDPYNQRFDVTIQYMVEKHYGYLNLDSYRKPIQQKLLILKGEILDGEEFHRRYDEFYGKDEVTE